MKIFEAFGIQLSSIYFDEIVGSTQYATLVSTQNKKMVDPRLDWDSIPAQLDLIPLKGKTSQKKERIDPRCLSRNAGKTIRQLPKPWRWRLATTNS
jgi:hypothetical protein